MVAHLLLLYYSKNSIIHLFLMFIVCKEGVTLMIVNVMFISFETFEIDPTIENEVLNFWIVIPKYVI